MDTIAGGLGVMWTTALQIGELVELASSVYDPTETRVLVTHASPGREGLLAQLALTLHVSQNRTLLLSLLPSITLISLSFFFIRLTLQFLQVFISDTILRIMNLLVSQRLIISVTDYYSHNNNSCNCGMLLRNK